MIFHKRKGKIYKVEYTREEQKAADREIYRQLAEKHQQSNEDIDAVVLYALMAGYGWKKKRLRKFWDRFKLVHKELCDYYLMHEPGDNEYLAHRKLKQIGVDVHEWYLEDMRNGEN